MPSDQRPAEGFFEILEITTHIHKSRIELEAAPEILEKYRDNCALVYKWALQEGREVYAA